MAWIFGTDYEAKVAALASEIGSDHHEVIRQFLTEHLARNSLYDTKRKVGDVILKWTKSRDATGELTALALATINRFLDEQDRTFAATWYGRGSSWRSTEFACKRDGRPEEKKYFKRIEDPGIPGVIYVPLYDDRTAVVHIDFSHVRKWD